MVGIILSFVVIAVLGIVLPNFLNKQATYGSKLEEYIVSRNPTNTYDVEKYTKEYESKQQGII